jgi:hypothetical protein
MYKSEFELQKMCVQYLESLQALKTIDFFTAIINETHIGETKYKTNKGFDIGKFKKLKKQKEQGLNRGMPDLFILIKGRPFFIELKYRNNRCSEQQKEVIKSLNKNDMQAFLVYSFDEFRVLIDDLVRSVAKEIDLISDLETLLNSKNQTLESLKINLKNIIANNNYILNYEDLNYFKNKGKGSDRLKKLLDL